MPKNLTNLVGLARRLGLPRDWLKTEAEAGRIPSLLAGKRRLFNSEAVERALEDRAGETANHG